VVLEEVLSKITVYWHLIFGVLLVLLVLYGKGGIVGFLSRWDAKNGDES
jgi:branched-chain amino acid transport system permease protein